MQVQGCWLAEPHCLLPAPEMVPAVVPAYPEDRMDVPAGPTFCPMLDPPPAVVHGWRA